MNTSKENVTYFEVRDHQGILQLVFTLREAAETFIKYRDGWTITEVNNKGEEV